MLEWVTPPTYRLGSLVVEHPACARVVPGSIPGLAYSFLSQQAYLDGAQDPGLRDQKEKAAASTERT